jgi:hypothetical protein
MLAAAAAASATAAFAQDAPGGLRVAGATTDFGISAIGAYDSNVSRSNDQVASDRGLHPADFIFTPSATVNIVRMFGLQTLSLTGAAGYDFYDRNHQLNREHITFDGSLSGTVGPCKEAVTGSYTRLQSDLQDLVTTTVKNAADTKEAELSVNCGHDFGIAPTASVSGRWVNNSAEVMKTSDENTFTVNGGLAYQTPALGQISLYGEYSKSDYPNRRLVLGPKNVADGLDETSGGIRFEHQIGARIEGVVSVSYSSTDYRAPGEKTFSGMAYSADVTYAASDRLKFHIDFLRGPTATQSLNANAAEQNKYGGDVHIALGSRIALAVGGSIDDQTFRTNPFVQTNPQLENPLTSERINSVFSSVTFNVRPGIALTLEGRHDQRDANAAEFNYVSNRVTVTLLAKF